MTAVPVHAPKHAVAKESRTWLPKLRRPNPVTHKPAPKKKVVKAKVARITPTGQALFSVDAAGEVSQNAVLGFRGGVSSFALTTGKAIEDAFPSHWLVQVFESEEQRQVRINAQALASALQIAGRFIRR